MLISFDGRMEKLRGFVIRTLNFSFANLLQLSYKV